MNTVIAKQALRDLCMKALTRVGTSAQTAARVIDELMENECGGYPSHGILRLPDYLAGLQSGVLMAEALPVTTQLAPNIAMLDGNHAFGVHVRQALTTVLQQMTCESALAIACLRNGPHLGRLASIGRALASCRQRPLAVIGFCNFQGHGLRVAAPGDSRAKLCTNPLLLAFPTGANDPFVLDMSTSAVSEGTIRHYAQSEHPLSPGCLIDRNGHDVLDAAQLYNALDQVTLQPLGGQLAGHKGYGLAVAAELFAGVLTGGKHVAKPGLPGNGGLFLVIDPARMPGGLETIQAYARAAVEHCYSSADTANPIRFPGEGYSARMHATRNLDSISLPAPLLAAIRGYARSVDQEAHHEE